MRSVANSRNTRTTDEIVADVCAAMNVERVEIYRPARIVECSVFGEKFVDGSCPMTCDVCGEHEDVPHHGCDANGAPTKQIVRTAPFAYYGNDRLDVSPGSADPVGGWFAPSKPTSETLRCADNSGIAALLERARDQFEWEYTAEMRVRYGIVPGTEHWNTLSPSDATGVHYALARGVEPTPSAWNALLAMREVTLVCTCADASRCHRVLLARILEKLGATYAGEVR